MPTTETRIRTALFGGTFDPPHLGHLHLFHEASLMTPVRKIIVIPANLSNFKRGTTPASFSDRLEMVHLLAEDYRVLYPDDEMELEISSYEGDKGDISYTSETVRHFFPSIQTDGKVDLIIGDDQLEKLSLWHDFDYLVSHARFWCFSRHGGENRTKAEVIMIPSPVVDVSSSGIREGRETMLSQSVRKYIDDHKLYRT